VPDAPNRKTLPAALVGVMGGVVALVAYAIHWGTLAGFGGRVSVSVKGGTLAVVLGVVIVLLALAMAAVSRRGAVNGTSVAELVVGAISLGIGLYFVLSDTPFLRAAANHYSDVTGRSADRIETFLRLLANRGAITVSRSAGLYLFAIGGALAVVGGVMGIVAARSLTEPAPGRPGTPFEATERPTGGPLGAPPPPPGEPGPATPEAGGTGGGPVPPLPPEEPPKPGEPGSTPGAPG